MRCHDLTHRWPIAIQEVENSRRYSCCMHHFSEDQTTNWRDFTGLEHHGAASSNCGRNLCGDLIQWPVPRCDQANDTDSLTHDTSDTTLLLELHVFKRFYG